MARRRSPPPTSTATRTACAPTVDCQPVTADTCASSGAVWRDRDPGPADRRRLRVLLAAGHLALLAAQNRVGRVHPGRPGPRDPAAPVPDTRLVADVAGHTAPHRATGGVPRRPRRSAGAHRRAPAHHRED